MREEQYSDTRDLSVNRISLIFKKETKFVVTRDTITMSCNKCSVIFLMLIDGSLEHVRSNRELYLFSQTGIVSCCDTFQDVLS